MKNLNDRINLKTKARITGILYFCNFYCVSISIVFWKIPNHRFGRCHGNSEQYSQKRVVFPNRDRRSGYFSCGTRVNQGVS